jgi:hypothetical protein
MKPARIEGKVSNIEIIQFRICLFCRWGLKISGVSPPLREFFLLE